jgi:hypothetical protein
MYPVFTTFVEERVGVRRFHARCRFIVRANGEG